MNGECHSFLDICYILINAKYMYYIYNSTMFYICYSISIFNFQYFTVSLHKLFDEKYFILENYNIPK